MSVMVNSPLSSHLMSTLLQTASTILLFSIQAWLTQMDHPRKLWPSTIFIQHKAVWAVCATKMDHPCIGHILMTREAPEHLLLFRWMGRRLPLCKMEDLAPRF